MTGRISPSGSIGTETPRQDVIDGWNFKVAGTQQSGIGAQSLELTGLVPFVQLIGLYDQEEIDRMLGKKDSAFDRKVEFADPSAADSGGAYEFFDIKEYQKQTERQHKSFEEKIVSKYVKIFFTGATTGSESAGGDAHGNQSRRAVEKNGIVLATNASQVGNEAYEVDAAGFDTPKDSGGVGITDLQVETGTKDFLNRRYKLRLTITDPQTLNDKPEYVKLATLQSKFLIIYGWSNPEILSSWPEDFLPAPAITDVGATIDGEYFPNGRMMVDLSQNNTGGAWNAAIVATTMYDFAFNEVGQLEASFTFMPREISFMHTIRMPVIAPLMKRILGAGEIRPNTSVPTGQNQSSSPMPWSGNEQGVGEVFNVFGDSLLNIIRQEQQNYKLGQRSLSTFFDLIDTENAEEADTLSTWDQNGAELSGEQVANAEKFFKEQRDRQSNERFPDAGVGTGIYVEEKVPIPVDEQNSEQMFRYSYKSKIEYYYLGWVLEAMRLSLYQMNKKKAQRNETPYDLRFAYADVQPSSILNYASQTRLNAGIIPSVKNYTAEAMRHLLTHCIPAFNEGIDPLDISLRADGNLLFRAIRKSDLVVLNEDDVFKSGSRNSLSLYGYSYLWDGGTERMYRNWLQEWHALSYTEKIARIPNGDYRKSLVIDNNNLVRIMHPDFEEQILYNVIPNFRSSAFRATEVSGNRHTYTYYRLQPTGVDIRSSYNGAYIEEQLFNIMSQYSSRANDAGITIEGPVVGDARQSNKSLGYGFWYDKYFDDHFIGEAIFTYPDFDRSGDGAIKGMMRNQADNHLASKGTWYDDGIERSDRRALGIYGIIMPAVSARLYKEESYSLLQRQWYNDHVAYLRTLFESIIGKRIYETLQDGKRITDIAAEPIDLFWLTGKKYSHSSVTDTKEYNTSVISQHEAGSTDRFWSTVTYDKNGENLYSVEEAVNRAGAIVLQHGGIEMANLEKEVELLTEKVNGINSQLSNEGDESHIQRARRNIDWLATLTNSFYGQPDDYRAADESAMQRMINFEDRCVNSILGMSDKINFWESRIRLVLKELVTKDLIRMEEMPVNEDEQNVRYTISSKHFAPENVRDISTQATVGSHWIWYQNAAGNVPQPIPTTVGGHAVIVKDYTLVAINPDKLTQFRRSSENYADDEVFNISSLEASYGGEAAGVQKLADYARQWTMPELKAFGADRYVTIRTRGTFFIDEYIGLPGGQFSTNAEEDIRKDAKYPDPIPLIDSIGHFGSDEEWQRAQLESQNLTARQFAARLRSGVETGNDSLNNYILMNFCDQNIRNTYTFGTTAARAAEGSQLAGQWNSAVRRYENYLDNCKGLLKRYIAAKHDLIKTQRTLESQLETERSALSEATDRLRSFTDVLDVINDSTTPLSPFGQNTQFDVTIDIPQGGGRKMTLKGARAQQIAQRFAKKIVFGEGDIQNYGPPPGGKEYRNAPGSLYGWVNKGPGPDGDGTYGWPDEDLLLSLEYVGEGNEGHDEYIQRIEDRRNTDLSAYLFEANLSKDPHLIARDVQPDGNIAVQYSTVANSLDFPGRTVLNFYESEQILETEFNDLFEKKFGFPITIADPYIPTKLKTDIPWPTALTERNWRTGDKTTYRFVLEVDDDLDPVVELWDGTGSPTNRQYYKWYKLPWRFLPIGTENSGPQSSILYPRAIGARIARNEHLPDLPEDAVRSLVRTKENGYAGEPSESHKLNEPWKTNGEAYNSGDSSANLPGADSDYGGNSRLAYLGDDRAKIRQSSTVLSYQSAGRPAATTDYPYGIPPDIEVPEDLRAVGAAGQQGVRLTQNAADVDFGENYKNTSIMETTSIRRSGSYWPQMPATDISVHDILFTLPREFEFGYLSSVEGADENFEGGAELNVGVREWIYKYLINLLPFGRRIGMHPQRPDSALVGEKRWPDRLTEKKDRAGNVTSTEYHSELQVAKESHWKIRDVTYGDVFENVEAPVTTENDFGNKTIHAVSEIPIKREVIENLLSSRNTNMSLMQFLQQVITPSSIGVNGNIQIAGRNKNGIMELAVATVDYKGITDDLFKSAEERRAGSGRDMPLDQLLFDYKRKNSLIENIDMSSKMDPAAFLTYQNSSNMIQGPGRDYNILNLLSYEGVAEDFQEYLNGVTSISDAGETYSGMINIDMLNNVTIDRVRYSQLPSSVLDGFVAQNPERWAKITAMMQGQNNFTTDLLAFYMRSVTITIHGLTNIDPFNLIHVKGVLPSLEGIYIITNITDRVTPAGFQTILEGKLLRKKSGSADDNIGAPS